MPFLDKDKSKEAHLDLVNAADWVDTGSGHEFKPCNRGNPETSFYYRVDQENPDYINQSNKLKEIDMQKAKNTEIKPTKDKDDKRPAIRAAVAAIQNEDDLKAFIGRLIDILDCSNKSFYDSVLITDLNETLEVN